jgi:hypothetical protein
VAESWLHEVVSRQRPELWPRVGYMKLCVDRVLNGGRWLHEAVSRQRLELWLKVCYMVLCVDRDLKCG